VAAAPTPGRADWPRRVPAVRLTGSGRTAAIGGYLAAIAGCVLLLVITPSGRPKWNSIYAEDGATFLHQAVTGSWPGVILHPYGGYMHLVPRLIAGLATILPIGWAPIVFTGSSMLIRALLAAFVYRASADHLGAPAFRLLAAAAFIAVPAGETRDNVANLHWYLIAAAFWAVLWQAPSWGGAVLGTVVAVAAIDSDPLTLALAPLVLLRLATMRRRRDQLLLAGYVAAAVVQLLVVTHSGNADRPGFPWYRVGGIAAERVVLPFVAGRTQTNLTGVGLLLVALAIVAVIAWPGLRAGGRARLVVIAALAVDTVLLIVMWQHGERSIADPSRTLRGNSRYTVTPTILLVSALAASLSTFKPRAAPLLRAGNAAIAGGVSALVLCIMLFGQTTSRHGAGPTWHAQMRVARAECVLTGEPNAGLAIDPSGWRSVLPCRLLGVSGAPAGGVLFQPGKTGG